VTQSSPDISYYNAITRVAM